MVWRKQQSQDKFFQRAKADGYRARSAYKLTEICDRFKLIKPGQVVLDLGAAPGSWSQVARDRVGPKGTVVAVDLQRIDVLPGVKSYIRDIRDVDEVVRTLTAAAGRKADVVLSDVAPQASGVAFADQMRSIELVTYALEVATRALRPGGTFVVKVFQGEDLDLFIKRVRRYFPKLNVFVPEATRDESREEYVVARSFEVPAEMPSFFRKSPSDQPW